MLTGNLVEYYASVCLTIYLVLICFKDRISAIKDVKWIGRGGVLMDNGGPQPLSSGGSKIPCHLIIRFCGDGMVAGRRLR
jgi:hypothetical protein